MVNEINKTSFKNALMTKSNMRDFIEALSPEEQSKYGSYLTKFQNLHSAVKDTARANIHAIDVEGFVYENNRMKNDASFMGILTAIGSPVVAGGGIFAISQGSAALGSLFIAAAAGLYSTYNYMSNKFAEYSSGKKTVNNATEAVEVYTELVGRYDNLAKNQFALSQLLKEKQNEKLLGTSENTEIEKQILKLSVKAFTELESANDKLGNMLGKFELKVKDEIKSRRVKVDAAEITGLDVNPDLIYGKGRAVKVHDKSLSTLVVSKDEVEQAEEQFNKLVGARYREVMHAKRTSQFVMEDIRPTLAPTFADKISQQSNHIYTQMVNMISETLGIGVEKGR